MVVQEPERALTDPPPTPEAAHLQILATEHWSLLATRSLLWAEMYNRASMFLTTLSASVVALALVSQATDGGSDFSLFALLVLPVVLLIGVGTQLRLGVARDEDVVTVIGMNRLRHAYLDIAPELEPYFVTSHHDDPSSVAQTASPTAASRLVRILVGLPVLVGVINSALFGVIVALIAEHLQHPPVIHASVGAVAAMAASVVFVWYVPFRYLQSGIGSRFPAPPAG